MVNERSPSRPEPPGSARGRVNVSQRAEEAGSISAMIDYEILVQTIADWRAGVRPSAPNLPPIPAGVPESYEELESGVVDFDGDQDDSHEQQAEGYGAYTDAGDAQADQGEGQYDQAQYDQAQYDQAQYDQGQYDQAQYDQAQYDQPVPTESYEDEDPNT